MSVTRVGANKKYSDNWDVIFGGPKRITAAKPAAKSAKRKAAKPSAKKKAHEKARRGK